MDRERRCVAPLFVAVNVNDNVNVNGSGATMTIDPADLVRRLLAALEGGATGDALAAFFHPDIEQVEQPNRMTPAGARRDRAAMLAGAEKGAGLMASQRYDVRNLIVDRDGRRVAAEVDWEATTAIALGPLPAGHVFRAHLAMFFELEDDRVRRIVNYDCYQP